MKKILLADDDADDREIFESVLERKKNAAHLLSVENGVEVISRLDEIADETAFPDLIILDHNMPKMNGIETLEVLKSNSRYKNIAVAIYSTYNDNRMKEKCFGLGAAMVLLKPSTMREYEATIDRFLEIS